MPNPTAVQKLRANLDYLRKRGAPKDAIDNEIAKFRASQDRISADERKLSGVEKVAAVGSKLGSGATFGLLDEAVGIFDKDSKNEQRFLQKQLEEENPALAFGAEVAGGFAMPGSIFKAAPKAASFARKAGKVLAEGAAQGGLSGAGSAEGGLEERVRGAMAGGLAGSASAGVLSGVGRGLRAARAKGAKIRGAPTLDELVAQQAPSDIARAKLRFEELNQRGLGDEAMVADVLPNGPGALRSQATANKDVRTNVDKELRSRSNRLANLGDERFSQHTGTQRQSARKSVEELNTEARARAKPHYETSEQEAGRFTAQANKQLPEGITLRNEVTGHSGGQTDGRITAVDEHFNGKARGYLDYDFYDGALRVKMVEVDPAMRRHGIASKMYEQLEKEFPGAKWSDAMKTPDGVAVRGAVDKTRSAKNAIAEATSLPNVSAAVKRVQKSADFKDLAPDDHKVLDQAYKEIGEDIRLLKAKKSANNLSTAERREMMDLIDERTKLKEAISSRAPSYPKALSEFADPMARVDAYKQGSKPTPADMIASEMADLDPAQANSYREGKAQRMRGELPAAELGEFARFKSVVEPISSREKVDVFKATFGEKKFNEYLRDVIEMAKLQAMKAGAGESTTVDKLLEQAHANPEVLSVVMDLLQGNFMNAGKKGVSQLLMGGVDRLLASGKNARRNASVLMRKGQDIPKTLDEMVRMRSAAEQPGARDWRRASPSNVAAREAGAATGRNYRTRNY